MKTKEMVYLLILVFSRRRIALNHLTLINLDLMILKEVAQTEPQFCVLSEHSRYEGYFFENASCLVACLAERNRGYSLRPSSGEWRRNPCSLRHSLCLLTRVAERKSIWGGASGSLSSINLRAYWNFVSSFPETNRQVHSGSHREIVLAFDVGTTFSGISYWPV